jgi:hypothetical protein
MSFLKMPDFLFLRLIAAFTNALTLGKFSFLMSSVPSLPLKV